MGYEGLLLCIVEGTISLYVQSSSILSITQLDPLFMTKADSVVRIKVLPISASLRSYPENANGCVDFCFTE